MSRSSLNDVQSKPNQYKWENWPPKAEGSLSTMRGPLATIGLTRREKFLRTTQWSILIQYNPCRYCKRFHMTLQRKGIYKHLSQEGFRLEIKKIQMSTVSSYLSLFIVFFHHVSCLVDMVKLQMRRFV